MMDKVKNCLKKYKNKILTYVIVFLCLPFFTFNVFAFTLPLDGYLFYNPSNLNMRLRIYSSVGDVDLVNSYNISNGLEFSNANFPNQTSYTGVLGFRYSFGSSSGLFEFPFDFSNYDYYSSLTVVNNASSTAMNFEPTSFSICPYVDGTLQFIHLSDLSVLSAGGGTSDGFTIIGKIPDNINSSYIYGFRVLGSSGSVADGDFIVNAYIWQIPKGDDYTNADVITAINNQTTTLGGKIDDINNFIDKGNSSTGGIVSNFQDKDNELNDVVSQYRDVENQFFEDFNTNQSAITSDIVGWSWGGLVNCADWVGTTLTDYYNNMGDFRQYIIYPLMLGIALFFLGRGGSIIGHLFRKPKQSTVDIESTTFKRGNTRYTTTTTSSKGGVFRK